MCAVGLTERSKEMQITVTFSVVHTISPFGNCTLSPSGQTTPHPPCVQREQDEGSMHFTSGSLLRAVLQEVSRSSIGREEAEIPAGVTLGPQVHYRHSQSIFLSTLLGLGIFLLVFLFIMCILPTLIKVLKHKKFHIHMER